MLGVVPLLLATIMGYCVTGYIRDELYSDNIKRCIGPCCSFFVSGHMTCHVMYVLLSLGDAAQLCLSVTMDTGSSGSGGGAYSICSAQDRLFCCIRQ